MIAFLARGGVLMLPILLCSILAVGFIVEKWRYFRQAKSDTEKLQRELIPFIENNRLGEAVSLCRNFPGLIPQIFRAALENEMEVQDKFKGKRKKEEEESTRRAITEEIQLNTIPHLEKYLDILDSLARGTPLLGLLGTVVGMIRMFGVISQTGLGEPDALAKGIGIALLTTAAGLTVAIPTFFAHSYFAARVDAFVMEIEKSVAWLLRQLEKRTLPVRSLKVKKKQPPESIEEG